MARAGGSSEPDTANRDPGGARDHPRRSGNRAGHAPTEQRRAADPADAGRQDTPTTAEELAHASDRLAAHGLIVSDDLLAELAGQYGVGGAVRIVAWSNGDDAAIADIRAMRDGTETEPGMGWGRIAKELGVHPGIGSIMGGGSGPDDAPGQQGTDEGD